MAKFLKGYVNFTILTTLSRLILVEATSQREIFEFAHSVVDTWQLTKVTLIDDVDHYTDTEAIQALKYYGHTAAITSRIISSKNISYEDVSSAGLQHGAFVMDYNSNIFNKLSLGLLEKTIWFVTAESDIGQITLRLNSQLYLYKMDNDTMRIYEAFTIKNTSRTKKSIGSWSQGTGLLLDNFNTWERRKDLTNIPIINALVATNLPPVAMVAKTESGIKATGYLLELLTILSEALNFNVIHTITPDGQYGSLNPDGTWNGLIGMLSRKEADVSAGSLQITNERSRAADFVIPLFEAQNTLIIKRPTDGRVLNVLAYLMTFTITPWVIVGLSAITFAIGLTFIGISGIEHLAHTRQFSLANSLGMVFTSLLQRDLQFFRIRNSTHILVFVLCMYSYLMFSYFSAVLTSYMTVLEPQSVIQSFYDIPKEGYHMMTAKGSRLDSFLRDSKPPSIFYQIYNNDMRHNPDAFQVSNQAMLEVVRKKPKTAVFGTSILAYGMPDLMALDIDEAPKALNSMALQKNSEFTRLFSYHFLKMQQSGIRAKVYKKWFGKKRSHDNDGLDEEVIVLSYDNLIFPYIILCGGILFGICGIIIEILIKRLDFKCL